MNKNNDGVIYDNDRFVMKMRNDGKGHSQSYECYLEIKDDCDNSTGFYGYGESLSEAQEICLEKLSKHCDMVNYTKESIELDMKLEKAGVKSYLNKVDVLWEDTMGRYDMVKTMLESKGFVCTTEFSPMIGPSSRFEKGSIVLIMSCILPKDKLTVFNSGMPILHSDKFDFTNIVNLEQLVDMLIAGIL